MEAVGAFLRCLEAEGVEHVFGVPGAALTSLYETLEEGSIKHILARHEGGAAFMATAYARVRRRLSVCWATTGPGGTNALTGIASAFADSVPVLLVTGQTPLRYFGKGALQDSTCMGIDLVDIFRPVTKLSVMVPNAGRMQEIVRHAIRVALTGRPGPVHLSMPADILKEVAPVDPVAPAYYRPRAEPVDRIAIAEAARLFSTAKRPCILAGHGVTVAGGWGELLELVERFRIPVATTPKGKGVLPETHPLSLGVLGFGGHPRAEAYILSGHVDLLLVVGTSLAELSTNEWDGRLCPKGGLIQIDIDPAQIGKNYPTAVGVVGDARAALAEFGEQLEKSQSDRFWEDDPLQDLREQVPRLVGTEYRSMGGAALKPQQVVDEMRAALPDDALLFVDNGNSIIWATHLFESRKPNTYFLSLGLASMGAAVAGVVGGKLAAPDKVVVALVGDAAFAMNGMEVHTAVNHDIDAIWVVLNNSGHGMVYHGERMVLDRHLNACIFEKPLDVAGLATAMGARAFVADSVHSFREAMRAALESKGPTVIDARIDPEEVPYLLARRARTVAKSFTDTMPPSMRIPKWPR